MHYFHLVNSHATLDRDGTDLPDLSSVRKEALRAAREMLRRADHQRFGVAGVPSEQLWVGEPWKVWVTDKPDGSGQTILTIELSVR
jgi:hypothetical protein